MIIKRKTENSGAFFHCFLRNGAKRLFWVMLLVCMALCLLLPAASVKTEAATGMTLKELQAKFPGIGDGKTNYNTYWNHADNPGSSNNNQDGWTTTPCQKHTSGVSNTCNAFCLNGTNYSWQCMGYAEKLGYDATGYNPRLNKNGWQTYSSSSAVDSIKAGDIVCYNNGGHTIYVTAVNGDTVTYTDVNSDYQCIIKWNKQVSKSALKNSFSFLRSAPQELQTGNDSYSLDVNAYLDGTLCGDAGDYGTFDVYINGTRVADDVNDYYTSWPEGTTYQITDIRANDGYTYDGIRNSTSLSGTLHGNREVRLVFNTAGRGPSNVTVAKGLYKLSPACAPGSCLDSEGRTTDSGANVVINGSDGHASQIFYISGTGDGYYYLRPGNGGCALDMEGGGSEAGNNVQYCTYNGTSAQQWAFYDAGDGYIIIAPRDNTLLSLDVDNAWTDDGTNVNAWYDNGSDAQRWKLNASGGYTYAVDGSGNATITGYLGSAGVLTIPSVIDGHPVTVIGKSAFSRNSKLTSVTIPASVTTIGHWAFDDCLSLTGITIPDSVESIGTAAFQGCKAATYVSIGSGVKTIGSSAFNICDNLTEVTIPSSVTFIGSGAFAQCDRLTKISVAAGNADYRSINGVLFNYSGTLLHSFPAGLSGTYTIPSGVTSIAENAFCGCYGLTSITIPASVTTIAEYAFDCCALSDVWYGGTQAQWNQISIGSNNDPLLNATLHCTAPLTVTSLTANKTSANVGDPITWTATATGGSGTLKYCFYIYNGSTAVWKGSYGTARTVTYTPGEAGAWKVKVFVKDTAGNSVSKLGGAVTVTDSTTPLTVTSLTANKTSANVGDPITWTASATGGSGTVQYCFYVYNGSTVVQKGSYGASKTVSYTPTEAGSYKAKVFVKDAAGATANTVSGTVTVASATPLTVTSIKANKTSAKVGESITWTASATGGSGTVQYCFYVYNGSAVVKKGSYSTAKTYTYTPTEAGSWKAKVFVKDAAGATANKVSSTVTVASATPLTVTSIKANKTSANVGDSITWTATAAGGSGTLKYCFYVYKGDAVVQKGTTYGTGRTVTYTPTAAGVWKVKVFVMDAAGTKISLLGGAVTVTAPSSPLSITSLKANKTSANLGDSITWTATATGGSGTLKYCFYIYNGNTIVQKGTTYGTGRTVTYTPTSAGTWKAKVFVMDGAGTKVSLLGGNVTVTAPSSPLTVTGIKANTSMTTVGDPITWTATATGGSGTLKYCFYIYKDGTVIQKGTAYGTGRTVTYAPTSAGIYSAKVFVMDAAGTKISLLGGSVTVNGFNAPLREPLPELWPSDEDGRQDFPAPTRVTSPDADVPGKIVLPGV